MSVQILHRVDCLAQRMLLSALHFQYCTHPLALTFGGKHCVILKAKALGRDEDLEVRMLYIISELNSPLGENK